MKEFCGSAKEREQKKKKKKENTYRGTYKREIVWKLGGAEFNGQYLGKW